MAPTVYSLPGQKVRNVIDCSLWAIQAYILPDLAVNPRCKSHPKFLTETHAKRAAKSLLPIFLAN